MTLPRTHKWNIILFANLALGLILWFQLCTDFVWENLWLDLAYAPVVGIIGTTILLASRKLPMVSKWLRYVCCLPAVAGGLPAALLRIGIFIPPLTLGGMFWLDEQIGKTQIQAAVSPDGTRTAEVYFRGVGAYAGGNGRIEVYLKYNWLPFMKRYVYYLGKSYADEETTNYLSWHDNDTIYLSEKGEYVSVRGLQLRPPWMITLPIAIVRGLLGR